MSLPFVFLPQKFSAFKSFFSYVYLARFLLLFCSWPKEFMLSFLLTHSTTTWWTISDNSCTMQISKHVNQWTLRCYRLAPLHPLIWSASASILLPVYAPASNVNNDLYFHTRSSSHLAFEPQSVKSPSTSAAPFAARDLLYEKALAFRSLGHLRFGRNAECS